ncbi:hypothetical protein AVEN_206408-1 [Araneus ventricosus]|uniref:Uncharacterized protein n=1 Tax=Araneus ventricosus TaxID=182803 RepID=A0A4Y2EK47_ARAVE|nr:hypothetical protein AVEN_206408-1 [Araneus ventricosus]
MNSNSPRQRKEDQFKYKPPVDFLFKFNILVLLSISLSTDFLLLACLRGREPKEINPNGLGASRMRAISSEYTNEQTKESAFITEKTPPVKNVKT